MNKYNLQIEPASLEAEIEEKINTTIPVKTKESKSFFEDNYDIKKFKKKNLIKVNNIIPKRKIKQKLSINNNNISNKSYSLSLRQNTLNNSKINNSKTILTETEIVENILLSRKYLHELYTEQKRINHSFKELNSLENQIKATKNKKINNNKNKIIQKNRLIKVKKLEIYDPESKSLRYKHYTENNNYNFSKDKTKAKKGIIKNVNNFYIKKSNINNNNNYINDSNRILENYKKENKRNLLKFKNSIFKKKNLYTHKISHNEVSKSNNLTNNKIKEKIKELINKQRENLENSIDDYNKQLEANFNRKKLLFKSYKEKRYLTDVNDKEKNENDYAPDNMNIFMVDFRFKRENKF